MALKATGPGKASVAEDKVFLLFNFDIDGASLKEEHRAFLRNHVIPALKQGSSYELIGMTDRTGSDSYNKALASRRMDAMAAFLRSEVSPTLAPTSTTSKGEEAARTFGLADNTGSEEFRGVFIKLTDKPRPAPVVTKKDDFVIYFEGNLPEETIPAEEVLSTAFLTEKYKTNRNLLRSGFRMINVEGDIAKNGVEESVKAAKLSHRSGNIGRVYIFGASAGGIVALRLAKRMTFEDVPLRFVAVTDSAFFPNEAVARPSSEDDDDPLFNTGGPIKADIKLNWYHRLGNHTTQINRTFTRQWTSSMKFGEIHGRIQGMDSISNKGDLTAEVDKLENVNRTDLGFHIKCNEIALLRIRSLIVADLNKNP